MTVTATEIIPEIPSEESRGGAHPDWDRARPGEGLPDRDDERYDPEDPGFEAGVPDDACGLGECEDDRDLRSRHGGEPGTAPSMRPWYHCPLGCGGD